MTEFGKRGLGYIARNGVVVDSIPSGEIACVIYSGYQDVLYILPRSIYSQYDNELYKSLSKNQRSKLLTNFAFGDNVEFEALSSGEITWVCKIYRILELIVSGKKKIILNTTGVIMNDISRRLWTNRYSFVKATEEQLKGVLSDVPLNCTIEMQLNYGVNEDHTKFKIETFRPKFEFFLFSFLSVAFEEREIIYNTPWNKITNIHNIDDNVKNNDKYSRLIENGSKNFNDKKIFKNVSCVAIAVNKLYSPKYSKRPIKIAYLKLSDIDFAVGSLFVVDIYFCSLNNCYIAINYRILNEKVHCKPDKYFQFRFLTELNYDESTKTYKNEIFGVLQDPHELLKLSKNKVSVVPAWVAIMYNKEDNRYVFQIVNANSRNAPPEKSMQSECNFSELSYQSDTELSLVSSNNVQESNKTENNSKNESVQNLSALSLQIVSEIGAHPSTYSILNDCGLLNFFIKIYNRI